jgi:hypothetical protein
MRSSYPGSHQKKVDVEWVIYAKIFDNNEDLGLYVSGLLYVIHLDNELKGFGPYQRYF